MKYLLILFGALLFNNCDITGVNVNKCQQLCEDKGGVETINSTVPHECRCKDGASYWISDGRVKK